MRASFLRFILILPVAVVPLVWALWLTHAANRTWTGNGGNNLWTTAANWNGGLVAPSAGDDLVFPSSNPTASANKFAIGTTFNSISVSFGHSMTGNSINLNSGITATGGVIDLSSIKLNDHQTFNAPTAGFGTVIDSAIDNNDKNLTLSGPGGFTINGSISGSGDLTKDGTGTTQLAGNNVSYTGTTTVNQGRLFVFGDQRFSNVRINDGILGGAGNIGGITFGALGGGGITPNAPNNGPGVLTVNGSAIFQVGVSASPGFLQIDLNSTTVGTGYDQLKVNGTVNLGSASPFSGLRVNLHFTPPPGTTFTIIDNDGTDAVRGQFANLPESSTFTVNGTTFSITYQGGTNANDVVLTVVSGVLSFTASSFTAQEGVGAANITLSRTGGSNTTAVAKVTLADVTTSPADYRFAPGALDTTFDPGSGTNDQMNTIAVQADGKIIIGGHFTDYDGTARNRIARLNADGSLDSTFNPGSGPNGQVLTTALQADGKIIIGGFFTDYNGVPRNSLARLNSNGSLDGTFNPVSGVNNNSVLTTAVQADGKILIGGSFNSYNGTPRNRIARLNGDGSLDVTFDPGSGANGQVNTLALQADGKIVIGGAFSTYNGTSRNKIARLNADGSLDTMFDPGAGASNSVLTTALQADGKIIIGGLFTTFNGIARNRITRLNSDGSLDVTFDPGSGANGIVNHQVATTALQADGKVIIGGFFLDYNGTARSKIARLNANGSLDNTFNPGSGLAGSGSIVNVAVLTTALQADGKIIIGGAFNSYNGTSRNRIARVDGDLFATWGPNDFTNKTITLPLVSDGLVEGNETLNLTLVPLAGTIAGTPSNATLTIVDVAMRRWDGGSSVDTNWQTKENWEGDVAPLPGDDLEFPAGPTQLITVNNFPLGTTFNSITLSGAGYSLLGNDIALNAGVRETVTSNGNNNLINTPIKLNANQTFLTTGPAGGRILSLGTIDTNGKILTVDGTSACNLNLAIRGGGGITRIGSSLTVLNGNNIQFTGFTKVESGTLAIQGNQANSAAVVIGGVLSGGGTSGPITVSGGTISAGGFGTIAPVLTTIGGLALDSASTFEAKRFLFSGNLVFNQVNVQGAVNLGGSLLSVPTSVLPSNNTSIIINNDGSDAVVGTFSGLTEGSIVGSGIHQFQLSYIGGNGNDVTLTTLPALVPAVQFSPPNLSVSENSGTATLTVHRNGDISSAVTVDFRTADTDNFTVGCFDNFNNQGGAFGRCDFATVVGTLQFSANETDKLITVPIIDDSFVEGTETFQVVLENPVGGNLGGQHIATVTIQANDTAGLPNPIFQSPFFVRQHYLDFLSREPDTDGFNAWLALLNGCPDVNNIDPNFPSAACDRIIVSQSFFGSQEFQLKGFYVFRFYKLAFNRLPEYLEIVSDMSFVAGTTAQEVFQRKAQLAVKFTQRPEFQTAFGGLTNAAYVNALLSRYQLTQITTPDPQQPDGTQKVTLTTADLTNQLNNATLTRAQVLRAVADSDQVATAEFKNAFVATQYYGYLRRKPDDAGFNAWLGVLQTGDSRTMINGFMNSQEYRLRFGPQ